MNLLPTNTPAQQTIISYLETFALNLLDTTQDRVRVKGDTYTYTHQTFVVNENVSFSLTHSIHNELGSIIWTIHIPNDINLYDNQFDEEWVAHVNAYVESLPIHDKFNDVLVKWGLTNESVN